MKIYFRPYEFRAVYQLFASFVTGTSSRFAVLSFLILK